jgi:uncharacterized protein (TIGR00251 family)
MTWYRREGTTLLIDLHVQPGARRTEAAGVHGERLKLRVAGQAVEGQANRELIRYLARRLGTPPSRICIRRGETGRHKLVAVEAADANPDVLLKAES